MVLACGGLALFHNQLLALLVTAPHGPKSVAVGDKVPDFTVTDVAGKAWTLSDLQKRTASGVVSLTFWCTFCHSCRMMDARWPDGRASGNPVFVIVQGVARRKARGVRRANSTPCVSRLTPVTTPERLPFHNPGERHGPPVARSDWMRSGLSYAPRSFGECRRSARKDQWVSHFECTFDQFDRLRRFGLPGRHSRSPVNTASVKGSIRKLKDTCGSGLSSQ